MDTPNIKPSGLNPINNITSVLSNRKDNQTEKNRAGDTGEARLNRAKKSNQVQTYEARSKHR